MASKDKAKKTSKINTWKPTKSQTIVERDGKLFICNFDKVFGHKDKMDSYRTFLIGKESYINQLDTIVAYTNFFMNNYDPDNELVTSYLKIKFELDKHKAYDETNMDAYIDFIYATMFTPSMVQKIIKMVEENYLDDIETNTDEKKKYLKSAKQHLESLEFTNQHIKILLEISFGMKIMSPALFHYVQKSHIKIEKDSDIIFRFYKKLFKLFGYGNTYLQYMVTGDSEDTVIVKDIPEEIAKDIIQEKNLKSTYKNDTGEERWYFYEGDTLCYYRKSEINMYNKLYVYVKAKVLESNANNKLIYDQREIFGVDVYNVVNQFTKKVLISENMVKYKFNEHWDEKQGKYKENIVGFNKTIIKFQLNYFLKEQYIKDLTEVTNTKNSEGLSGSDKMLMNASKIDEGVVTMADINTEITIERIRKQIDIPISEDEIRYYMENYSPNGLQVQLIREYYAKYFGSYRDLTLLPKRSFVILMLLLKKKLLLELGYGIEEDEGEDVHYAALPYILSGNIIDKQNTRIIRNTKYINKIEDNYMYQNIIETKYKMLQYINPDAIIKILSSLINTRFSYCVYERPDLLGQEIVYSEDKISDEVLFFLQSI